MISEDGKSLQVSQKDPLGRGLLWEQDLSFLVVYPDGGTEDVQVSFGKEQASCLKELKRQASEGCFVMPNADGKGYGFFRLLEKDAKACLGNLPACKDEVLRGSLLITLYENLLNRTIPAELYMEAMLDYLPTENNSLLFSAALGYIGNCQRFYLADPEKLELVLWRIVTMAEQSQQRLQAFRQYRSIARSPEAVGKLYALWKDQKRLLDVR